MNKAAPSDVEEIERALLLEGIALRYGYDLREYDPRRVRTAVARRLKEEGTPTLPLLLERVLRDPCLLERVLKDLRGRPRAMFSPAAYYRALRARVLPFLRTYPSVTVWAFGSGPEDVYSLAILFREALRRDFRLYVTDLHESLLDEARSGVLRGGDASRHRRNYRESGGERSFEDYHTAVNGEIRLSAALRKGLVFAAHNPGTDAVFREFQAVFAGDALARFGPALRERALGLIDDSLRPLGFLALGRRGALRGSRFEGIYRELDRRFGLYQKALGPRPR